VLPSLPPRVMVEQDWTSSTITPGHLQKLIKHGFLAVTEHKACHVLEDPAFPHLQKDTWCPLWPSMSGDSVRHRTGSSTHFCNIMASSSIT
jgi:hypothetical protein